jgi:hypothetical protein
VECEWVVQDPDTERSDSQQQIAPVTVYRDVARTVPKYVPDITLEWVIYPSDGDFEC